MTFHRELRLDRLAISALRWQLFGTGAVAMVHLIQQPAEGYTIHLAANAAFCRNGHHLHSA